MTNYNAYWLPNPGYGHALGALWQRCGAGRYAQRRGAQDSERILPVSVQAAGRVEQSIRPLGLLAGHWFQQPASQRIGPGVEQFDLDQIADRRLAGEMDRLEPR